MVMSSVLAKPLIAMLIGLPTLTAVLAIIFGYQCRIGIPHRGGVPLPATHDTRVSSPANGPIRRVRENVNHCRSATTSGRLRPTAEPLVQPLPGPCANPGHPGRCLKRGIRGLVAA
jgi:hypothetical protein